MPPTAHNIHFGTGSGSGLFLQLGPTEPLIGAWFFGSFRITEHTGGYRVHGVEIPFADGLKDAGDGKRTAGTTTVEGWVHNTNTYLADGAAKTILGYFVPGGVARKDYFVWCDYDGTAGSTQKIRRLQSWRIGEVEGWGGERWEVSLTFAVYDPEF